MKRDTRRWKIICLGMALHLFWGVMAEARPKHFILPPPPGMVRDVDVFKESQHHPAPVFFWGLSRKVFHREDIGLSAAQKASIQEAFWELLIAAIEIEQQTLPENQTVCHGRSDTADLQMEHVISRYMSTVSSILTPEQRDILLKRQGRIKIFAKFRCESEFQKLGLPPDASTFRELLRIHPEAAAIHVALEETLRADVTQERSTKFSTQYLHQLQILRL